MTIDIADIKLAKNADIDAFARIVNATSSGLLRYIIRISSFSYEEAEEVLQEVFIKAWRYINEYDESFAFSTWIYRIAHNTTISEFRKYTSRGSDKKVDWNPEEVEQIASGLNIELQMHQKQMQEMVQHVLGFLSSKEKEILVLRFLEQKSYDEISDILKMPVNTVATNLSRAKKQFMATLSRHYPSFSL